MQKNNIVKLKRIIVAIPILFFSCNAKNHDPDKVEDPVINTPVILSKEFGLDNGILHLKQDVTRGGAISYISKSGAGGYNIVNTADNGRYIQQSYYAGVPVNRQSEGQNASYSPWMWNPVQAGDIFGNNSVLIDSIRTDSSTYVKCTPLLWDMKNMPAEAEMEQWTVLSGNVLRIKNRITCHRTDYIYPEGAKRDQELPAVYVRSTFNNLYSYFGNAPFTGGNLDNPSLVDLAINVAGNYTEVNENWMAVVDHDLYGIGLYNPTTSYFHAGQSVSGATVYLSSIKSTTLNKNTVYEFEYYLVIGSLTEIRTAIYKIHDHLNP